MHTLTHFLFQHGYLIVFSGVLAEQLGLPFPSGSLLLAAGALLGTHRLNPVAVLGTAVTASLISDSVWYCRTAARRNDSGTRLQGFLGSGYVRFTNARLLFQIRGQGSFVLQVYTGVRHAWTTDGGLGGPGCHGNFCRLTQVAPSPGPATTSCSAGCFAPS